MDLVLLQSYIAFKAPSPRNMLFLSDPSRILPIQGPLAVLDRNFEIINYENDLQVRDALERYKDDTQGRRFCIVSSRNQDENIMIWDYAVRSNCITITPQALLEFSQKSHNWPEEVNQLRASDFWDNLSRLQKLREGSPGNISSAECSNIILSAMLDIDLSKAIMPREAIGLQKKLESDERITQLRRKYPDLVDALERLVREAIPLMAKIGQDDDLAKVLWVAYSLAQRNDNYELFLPRILGREIWEKYGQIPLDKAKEICDQLIERDPERVIEQVKAVEDWLSQDNQRIRVFRDWLGLSSGSIVKTAEFAATERVFCIPLKESLRTVARAIVSSSVPTVITPQLQQKILKNITTNHIFLKDDTTYMRLRDAFDAFARLTEFLELMAEIRKKDWFRSKERLDSIDLWTREIYPKYISRVELLRDRIETLNFRCDLLSSSHMQKVIEDARQVLKTLGESFADLIQKHYTAWIMGIETPRPLLTTDFIPKVFQPFLERYVKDEQQAAYIIVFDGMRWDEWELLRPKILQTFQGKLALEDVIPLMAILPSTTEWARRAIFAGSLPADFAAESESELLREALGTEQIAEVQTYGESPGKRESVLKFLEDASQVKPIIFSLIDLKLHSMMQNLVTLYEEVEVNFNNTIQPYLEKIPPNSLVFILSDHGFVELTGKGMIAPGKKEADPHRRYIGLRSFDKRTDISASDFIFFSTENIRMPAESNIVKYGFARPGRFISSAREQESSPAIRYAHGGVSFQEMIVPCAVFVPKNKGQLTMF